MEADMIHEAENRQIDAEKNPVRNLVGVNC